MLLVCMSQVLQQDTSKTLLLFHTVTLEREKHGCELGHECIALEIALYRLYTLLLACMSQVLQQDTSNSSFISSS